MSVNNSFSSLEKAIVILKYLAEEPYQFTAIEISKALDINRSTVHRILGVLKNEMIVLQSPSTKKYKLGPQSYHIGSAYLYTSNYTDDIFHIVDETAKILQLSVGYTIIDNNKIINIYENEHYLGMRMGYKPGSFYPIHCGSYGKTIMAYYTPEDKLREIVYSSQLEKRTENTITDPEELLKEYAQIRSQGYSISDEENIKGAIGVGAPVRNSKGEVIASIAAAGIKASLLPEELDFVIKVIVNAANRITKLIP